MRKAYIRLILTVIVLLGIIFIYTYSQYLLIYKSRSRVSEHIFLNFESSNELSYKEGKNGKIINGRDDWNELKLKYQTIKDGVISRSEHKIYVYSAYLDTRTKDDGAIIGIRVNSLIPYESNVNIGIGCKVMIEDKGYSKFIDGKTRVFIHKEHHKKEFVASTIYCNTRNDSVLLKENVDFKLSVAIILYEIENEENFSEITLKVKSTLDPGPEDKNYLSICVRPWWGEPTSINGEKINNKQIFSNIGLLLEFINAHIKLGIDKIYMYENYLGLSDDVLKLIELYSNEKKILEIVPFRIPILPFKQVWDFAQTSMIQDCLLRNTNKSEYLLFVDTDEFLFPTNSKYNLRSYFKLLDSSKNSNNIGALWIPMHFHFLEWETDVENKNRYKEIETKIMNYCENIEFVLYEKTCRMRKSGTTKGEKARRKVAVKPNKVLYMGIHEPEKMFKDYKFIKSPVINVKESVIYNNSDSVGLILHHYRKATSLVNNDPKQKELFSMYSNNNCSFNGNSSMNNQTVTIDNIVWDLFGIDIYNKILEDIIKIKLVNKYK
ncbi:conserve having a signal peptide [Cryptosporidium bovis]|uniref:conserve having a signal peptide n=1 Tax=Cryptosporidium bovis TaxID=310047 RepID=UPI00351A1CC2|nr:conserve having a signal peptide [Cryptosporidium bovis]